jgi:hypothetical protein
VPTGSIEDGQSVWISYVHDTPSLGRTDTFRVDFGAEQRFENGLRPYYSVSYQDQNVDNSSGFDALEDRTDHHRLGIDLDRERWHVGTELEIFDDSVDPYNALHVDGRYTFLRSTVQTMEGAARFSQFHFEGSENGRDVSLLDVELDHRLFVNDATSATARALYRWEDDSVDGTTNGVDLSLALRYVTGHLSVDLSVEYDLLRLPESDEDGVGVWLTVRRDFPNVLGSRR